MQLLLKMKGMTLANIKEFARLQKLGDESLPERIKMLDKHMGELYKQQANLAETISFVEHKLKGYQEKVPTQLERSYR